MLKRSLVLSAFVLGLAVAMLAINGLPAPLTASANETEKGTGSITVSGRGEIVVSPDVAYIQFGLETMGKTAQEAHEANAKQFDSIRKALKELKIEDKDIKTVQFSTYPQYDWSENKQTLRGYQVVQMIQVTYRDMNSIGQLLDKVSKAGVNRVDYIQFGTEKYQEYQIQALEKAVDNARAKADALAKKAGVSITGVASINENGISSPIVYKDFAVRVMENAAPATDVNPGELKIEANVTVSYTY